MTDPRNATNSPDPKDPFVTATQVGERKAGASAQAATGVAQPTGTTGQQAREEAGQVADTAKQQAAQVKDSAAQQAADLKDHATEQAKDVKDAALDATAQVAGTAKQEAAQVVGEARDQIQGLVDVTMGEVRNRARDGQVVLTNTLAGLTDELGSISRGEVTSGPVNQLVGELATRGEGLSAWLQAHEPEDVVVELRRFAARRPFAFLALAAGAGMVAGRLARGTREVARDEAERAEREAYRQRVAYDRQQPVQQAQATTGLPTYRTPDTTGAPSYRTVEAPGSVTGGLPQRGDRVETYGQPVVTEGYVHTTSDADLRGTEGGTR